MKQDITYAMQKLRDFLTLRAGSSLDRVELQLSSIDVTLADMQTKTIELDQASRSGALANADGTHAPPVSVSAYLRNKCDVDCSCTCHYRYRLGSPAVVNSILGRIFFGYVGLPLPMSTCDSRSCASSEVRSLQITYVFPSWFVRRRVEIAMGSNFVGSLGLNIMVRNPREYTSEHSLFQLARQGKVDAMKHRLSLREASPNDISHRGGCTAFDVSEFTSCSSAISDYCSGLCSVPCRP